MTVQTRLLKKTTQAARNKAASPSALPVPMTGETQLQFFLRAMRVLQKGVPSINARAIAVLRLWGESANGRELRDKGAARFPADLFVHSGPRCVFLEHTISARADGSRPEIVYDRQALQKLVDWANYRIANSDNFSVLSNGHTPSQQERAAGAPIPEVLGYAGPFYLGQLGDLDPKWAIYADEWIHIEDQPRFAKLQRRSPEVWVDEPLERRTMDPIAALGAETPRLDSGMNAYARVGDDRTVMRYSAATFPGPHNTFIPTGESRRKHHYAGDASMPLPKANDLADKVAAAIQELMPSFVNGVVQHLTADNPDFGEATVADRDATTAQAADESDKPDDDPQAQKYAADPACFEAYQAGLARGRMKYARGADDLHKVVARQQVKLQELTDQMSRERRNATRYSRLQELSREFAFDVRDEEQTCQDMSDKQFDRHCTATIVKYSKRDDTTNLQLFDDLEPDRYDRKSGARMKPDQIERYSREAAAIAARKNATKRGSTTFEAEFDAICKQHGATV